MYEMGLFILAAVCTLQAMAIRDNESDIKRLREDVAHWDKVLRKLATEQQRKA